MDFRDGKKGINRMLSRFFGNEKRIRIIAVVLTIFWMSIVFSFSAQNAEESSEVSRSLSYRMVEASAGALHLNWASEKIQDVANQIENGVRKAAHMTEYAILALFVGTGMNAWLWWPTGEGRITPFLRKIITTAVCAVYAGSDEFHQTMVPGRNGNVKDVFIDTAGALLMILILAGVTLRVKKKHRVSEK